MEPIPLTTAPNFRKSIEIVPGNKFLDSNLEGLVRGLNTEGAGQTIVNNNIITIINQTIISGLASVDTSARMIGHSINGTVSTGSNKVLRKTQDGQYVAFWLDKPSGNQIIVGVKAVAPYTNWTSLDGTSNVPTTVCSFSGGDVAPVPVVCQDSRTQNIYVLTQKDAGANTQIVAIPCIYNGDGTWTPGTEDALLTTSGTFSGEVMYSDMVNPQSGKLVFIQTGQYFSATNAAVLYYGEAHTAGSSTWANTRNFAFRS